MESCRLPIELCEKVMNALRGHEDEILDGTNSRMQEEYTSKRQPALRACALTCHAWRVRAQYLLWTFPVILDSQHLAHFRTAIQSSPNITITRGLVLGGIYGPNVLDLSTAEVLGSLLRDSFPALHSVTVYSGDELRLHEGTSGVPSWLHTIAIGRPIPGILKTIVLQHQTELKENYCCKEVVGTSEEVVGSEKQLPELLAGLAELTIRLDWCKDPERCAAYIWSVLPGMHDVLRFEYRVNWDDVWRPYTLPVAK
ncbi:hypothetical protein TRAPUB_3657 [Trametes pubescens]|uniref:F-box domain-containing protein n=1 Tax=Trametes pubescens TaxID=154538 RepID=A0A1M2VDA1_TRAPU|nr:hypothetical protein TRAPUB_3657 [Trametes pubescens]